MSDHKVGANLAKSLALAQAKFHAAKKDSVNPHFRSSYADLSSIIEAIKGPMAEFGLVYLQPITWENGSYFVETIILHSSGESMTLGKMRVPVPDMDGMNAQKVGSAITYTRRYHLSSALGISQEDDDGNATSHASGPTQARPPQQKPPVQQQAPNAPASDKQIGFIMQLAAELGIKVNRPATVQQASQMIKDLSDERTKRTNANPLPKQGQPPITTQDIPWN